MDVLKVAVIGCGGISNVHLDSINSSKQARLIAVCDIDQERAKEKAKMYQVPYYFDYRQVLDLELDAVHICTSHYTHVEIALAAIRKGIAVLTEKPMATKLVDADAMIAAAKDSQVPLGVIFQNRYNHSSIVVKDIVETSQLGKLLGCRMAVHWFRNDAYYDTSDWRGSWITEGGGALINQSIHTVDLMQWIMGDVESLQASIANRGHRSIEVEDVVEASLRFKNGAVGSLYATTCYSYNADILLEIHGELGVAIIEADQAVIRINGEPAKIIQPSKDNQFLGKSYWGASHGTQITKFYTSLLTKSPVEIDGKAGRKALEIVKAIYYSGDTGQAVTFPYQEDLGFLPNPLTPSRKA